TYKAQQRRTLVSDCHLVEIDLLRCGRHVLSIPEWRLIEFQPYASLVCVSRSDQRNRFELYPRRLPERLPRIRVPLVDSDWAVPLGIEGALEHVWNTGSYLLRVRYDEPCEPPLSAQDQQWANECWAAYRTARPDLFPQANP